MSGAGAAGPATVRRKFTRMGAGSGGMADMGAMGAFALLKAEAQSMQRTGIASLVNAPDTLAPLLHPYLSGSAAKAHVDSSGDEHRLANSKVFNEEQHSGKYKTTNTGTLPIQVDKEGAMNVYCNIFAQLKQRGMEEDHAPQFYLDTAAGAVKSMKSGGFQNLYPAINVASDVASKMEQDRCIFAMKTSDFIKVGGPAARRLLDEAARNVKGIYEQNVTPKVCHLLFHWNAHSFFTYHKDEEGDISVIINLSPSNAFMHVAGCEPAEYHGIGSGHIFPCSVQHRSGDAPRRCVKVAIFFGLDGPEDCTSSDKGEGDGAGSSSAPNPEETKETVKSETKDEEEPKPDEKPSDESGAPAPAKSRKRAARAS